MHTFCPLPSVCACPCDVRACPCDLLVTLSVCARWQSLLEFRLSSATSSCPRPTVAPLHYKKHLDSIVSRLSRRSFEQPRLGHRALRRSRPHSIFLMFRKNITHRYRHRLASTRPRSGLKRTSRRHQGPLRRALKRPRGHIEAASRPGRGQVK